LGAVFRACFSKLSIKKCATNSACGDPIVMPSFWLHHFPLNRKKYVDVNVCLNRSKIPVSTFSSNPPVVRTKI
jgi:hypothetical protein